jgi:hypothetical protein
VPIGVATRHPDFVLLSPCRGVPSIRGQSRCIIDLIKVSLLNSFDATNAPKIA